MSDVLRPWGGGFGDADMGDVGPVYFARRFFSDDMHFEFQTIGDFGYDVFATGFERHFTGIIGKQGDERPVMDG